MWLRMKEPQATHGAGALSILMLDVQPSPGTSSQIGSSPPGGYLGPDLAEQFQPDSAGFLRWLGRLNWDVF
jgi:hypothetical protein